MKRFHIHHPSGGALNTLCVPAQYMYEKVATVQAETLEHAFFQGQNDYNPKYRSANVRSTSVGDIIQEEDGTCYLIEGQGMKPVTNRWLTFIDWGIIDQIKEQV